MPLSHDGATRCCTSLASRTCRLYDRLSSSTWVNVKIISSSPFCGDFALFAILTPGSLTLPRFCASIFTQLSSRARSRIFWSGRRHDAHNQRSTCVAHSVCGGFQCVVSVVTTTAPTETFEHCCSIWVHDSPTVTFFGKAVVMTGIAKHHRTPWCVLVEKSLTT
jgi:hypothetical protein